MPVLPETEPLPLDLNGLNLYYLTLVGSSSQIINVAVPEPGSLTLLVIGSIVAMRTRTRSR
jgi:hypothetical protein